MNIVRVQSTSWWQIYLKIFGSPEVCSARIWDHHSVRTHWTLCCVLCVHSFLYVQDSKGVRKLKYEMWSHSVPPLLCAPYLPPTRSRGKPYKKMCPNVPNHWNGSLAAVTHRSYVRKSRCLQLVRTQLLSVRLNFYKIRRGRDQTSRHIGDNINHNNHQSSVFIGRCGYTICIPNGWRKPFQVSRFCAIASMG